MEEKAKPVFKKGDKVRYLNEEYIIEDVTDHYILFSTKEKTSVPVVHVNFGDEDWKMSLVEEAANENMSVRDFTEVRDGRDKKLYLVKNKLGTFYIVSRSFNEAAELLEQRLSYAEYGYMDDREVKSIDLIATERFMDNKQFFCGDNAKLIVEE